MKNARLDRRERSCARTTYFNLRERVFMLFLFVDVSYFSVSCIPVLVSVVYRVFLRLGYA